MVLIKKIIAIFHKAPEDLRKRIIGIFLLLICVNIGVWIITIFLSSKYPVLFGLVSLAYGLGLRHAVDADHIAAIDNTTRKLMQDGKRPVGVGFFFSLGHSTIVIILSILVAFSANFVKQNLPSFQETGSLIGTSISSIFLLIIGIINLIVLIDIIKVWRKVIRGKKYNEKEIHNHIHTKGFLARIFKPVLGTVRHSWNMYFIGFLFGLGFDTASEVGLLSISAATGVSGMPIGAIILLPAAFTAGMCLIDTLDGVLMLGAYGWAYIKPIRKLYYNMNITFISVVVALVIGGIEGLQIISAKLMLNGKFFNYINSLDFGNLGYIIIGIFVVSWIVSLIFYHVGKYDLIGVKSGRSKG